jgi:hypothetical protein
MAGRVLETLFFREVLLFVATAAGATDETDCATKTP